MNGSNQISVPSPNLSQVDLSCTHTTTSDWLRLFPVYTEEMVAGDVFHADVNLSVRMAQMATKMNGSAHVDLHAFFVPNRLLHDGWNAFILGDQRTATTTNNLPYITPVQINAVLADMLTHTGGAANAHAFASLLSQFGYPIEHYKKDGASAWRVPTSIPSTYKMSVLPLRALSKCYWDWYRDSQQIPESSKASYIDTSNGAVTSINNLKYLTKFRCFMKDYVTTALASPQLGDGGVVGISSILAAESHSWTTSNKKLTISAYSANANNGTDVIETPSAAAATAGTTSQVVRRQFNVNSFRFANAMQQFCEKLNVVGTRPMERLLALFGVQPTAERLDMAEYIGGKIVPLNFESLTNAAATDVIDATKYDNAFGIDVTGASKDMGTSVGTGGGQGQSGSFSFRATEHGIFLILASIVPDYTYKNRIPRSLIRGLMTPDIDRTAFLLPDFEGTGYQHLMLSEVMYPMETDNPTSTWLNSYKPGQVVGYQPRYEEYRSHMSQVSGDYVAAAGASSLQSTLFTRDYVGEFASPTNITAATAALHQGTQNNTSALDNIFQVTDDQFDHFMIDAKIVNNAQRPLTMNSLPTQLADLVHAGKTSNSLGGVRLGS